MLVCPGLVDAHVHVADGMMPVSMLADDAGLMSGVTTVVDAGSLGARTLPAFRKYIWPQARTRVRALLNLSAAGLVVLNELYLDDKLISRSRALRAIDSNRDLIVGIKVRVRGTADSLDKDLKLMAQLREIADETGLPTMMHWTNEARLVDMLRPGDCMTHPFNPAYLGPNCIDEQGRVRSLTRELADRGIMVDLGHGSSFDWKLAEAAASQGWYPDVLSTDMFSRYFRPGRRRRRHGRLALEVFAAGAGRGPGRAARDRGAGQDAGTVRRPWPITGGRGGRPVGARGPPGAFRVHRQPATEAGPHWDR
ncbi:MAG: hypothetical protein R3E68_14635 [Burkholderiaceae bacterium]